MESAGKIASKIREKLSDEEIAFVIEAMFKTLETSDERLPLVYLLKINGHLSPLIQKDIDFARLYAVWEDVTKTLEHLLKDARTNQNLPSSDNPVYRQVLKLNKLLQAMRGVPGIKKLGKLGA